MKVEKSWNALLLVKYGFKYTYIIADLFGVYTNN